MRRLLALTVLGVLIPAAQAAASDYYVTSAGGGDCSQAAPCDLPNAITVSDGHPGLDHIHVMGALTHTAPINLNNSAIELIGSGAGSGGTFIHPSTGAAVAVGPASTVRDVQAESNNAQAFQVAAGATLVGVAAATDVSSATQGAVEVVGSSATTSITDSTLTATNAVGLITDGPFQLTHSTVAADIGVIARTTPGTTVSRIERSKISARNGLQATGTHVAVAGSLILIDGTATGIFATGSSSSGPASQIDIRGSTIRHVSGATSGSIGVRAAGEDTSISVARGEVTVRSSIVRDFDKDLQTDAVSGPGRIAIDHSDFHSTFGAGIENGGANVDLDPHWLDPATGNYGLGADSPLIDIGGTGGLESVESVMDFAGLDRMLDGNADGVAARDMGAFEYPAPVASFTAMPDNATVGQSVSFDASASSYTRGELNRYEWDLDGNGTFEIDQGTATISHVYTAPGTVAVALRVTGPDGGRGRTTRTVTVVASEPGPGPPPGPGPDVVPPLVTFAGGVLVLGPSRVVKVRLTCAATEPEACAGPLRLETASKVRGKVVKLASKRFSIAPGKRVAVKLKLSKSKLKLIRKRKVKRVRAIATPRDKAGNSKRYKHLYRLKLARKLRAIR